MKRYLLFLPLVACAPSHHTTRNVYISTCDSVAVRAVLAQRLQAEIWIARSDAEVQQRYLESEARCVAAGQERACAEDDLFIHPELYHRP